MALSDQDRDLVTRTALAEAGDSGDPAAIAQDILDRAQAARVAPGEHVLARGNYPSWDDPKKIHGIDAKGKNYQRVAQAIDSAAASSDDAGVLAGFGVTGKTKPKPTIVPAPSAVRSDDADILRGLGVVPKAPGEKPAAPVLTGRTAAPTPEAQQLSDILGASGPIVEGIPLAGPGIQAGGAAISAAFDQPAPGEEKASFAERYANRLALQREANRVYAEQHPGRAIAGNLLGAAEGLGVLGATVPGRVMMGMPTAINPTFGGQFYGGAIGSAGFNALDAAARGENVYPGAFLGAVAGGTAPMFTRGAQAAVPYLMSRSGVGALPRELSGLNAPGRNMLIEAGQGGPTDLIGPAGFVGESNPALTSLMEGIVAKREEGARTIERAYNVRAGEAPARIGSYLEDAFGPRASVLDLERFYEDTRAAAADPLYAQFRSMRVQPTDELRNLIPRLQKAGAFERAEQLSGIGGEPIMAADFSPLWMHEVDPEKFPTTNAWNWVKRGLDSRIDAAYSAGDKELARELVKLKGETLDAIGKTDAGHVWRQARQEWASRSQLIDELAAGRDAFVGGRSGTTVEEFREEMRHLSDPEKAARKAGAYDVVAEALGETIHGANRQRDKLLAPNNREKLRALIGENKADELISRLQAERNISSVGKEGEVMRNSRTAGREALKEQVSPPPLPQWTPKPLEPLSWIPPRLLEELRPSTAIQGTREEVYRRARNALAEMLVRPNERSAALHAAIAEESTRRVARGRIGEAVGNVLAGASGVGGQTLRLRGYEPPGRGYLPAPISPAR